MKIPMDDPNICVEKVSAHSRPGPTCFYTWHNGEVPRRAPAPLPGILEHALESAAGLGIDGEDLQAVGLVGEPAGAAGVLEGADPGERGDLVRGHQDVDALSKVSCKVSKDYW